MITYMIGNLLEAQTDALVNTVNCVGYMGKGIALQFKQAFPENFQAYQKACKHQDVQPGKMFVSETGRWTHPKYIINFPTKRHWKGKSLIEDIANGLPALVQTIQDLDIKSIAIPPLGCGLGGLQWSQVKPMMERALAPLIDVQIMIYEPMAAPQVAQRPVGTAHPKLTRPRALLLALMKQYLLGDDDLNLLVVHKLAYFLQVAGEPLNLRVKQARYGPYADNLNKVLEVLEGHFTQGYDGSRKPYDELKLLPGAAQEANAFLEEQKSDLSAYKRVSKLIEGFDTPYGLELLSSVHWGAVSASPPVTNMTEMQNFIAEWNERKRKVFQTDHIQAAWEHLQKLGWITTPVS